MWLEKLSLGVLRILTPLGPRYVNPSIVERLYLLWIFRNFHTLPIKVLSARQQKRVDRMCAHHGFAPLHHELFDLPILGTLEQRPPMETENLPPRRASQGVTEAVPSFAADVRQQS